MIVTREIVIEAIYDAVYERLAPHILGKWTTKDWVDAMTAALDAIHQFAAVVPRRATDAMVVAACDAMAATDDSCTDADFVSAAVAAGDLTKELKS
jgi:hypothetical protein